MRAMNAVPTRELTWKQPSKRQRTYLLVAEDQVVATIHWVRGSLAEAESAEGRWTFKRAGFLRPRVTVRTEGSETDLAVFHSTWDGGGTLEFRDGRRYSWSNTNRMHTAWVWTGQSGAELLRFKGKSMQIESAGATTPGISLLALLSWYLNIMNNESSDAGAGVVGAIVATMG